MTTPDNFAAEPEHYLPQEVDEFNTICKHILRNELAAARKILDRRMRDGVAEQSNAADMIAEERDAWEKRAKTEATLRLQCANDSQMHLDRALAAEAENAALRRFAGECLEPWPECLCDLEGDMQSRLARAGLIEERIADHHGDDYEIGDSVFFLTDLGKAAIDAAMLAGEGGEMTTPKSVLIVKVKCVNCGVQKEVLADSISSDGVPVCDDCYSPMATVSVRVKTLPRTLAGKKP